MHTAALSCGTVLSFEARSFLPSTGETVPCLRHGYCVVESTQMSGSPELRWKSGAHRAPPRRRDELLSWLRDRRVATVHALREERFTLRLVASAERDGLVTVNLEAGTVAVLESERTLVG